MEKTQSQDININLLLDERVYVMYVMYYVSFICMIISHH